MWTQGLLNVQSWIRTRGLPTRGLVISRTGQLADAVSTSSCCFCGYFETPRANKYKNANK